MGLVAPTVTGYSEFWGGANAYAPLGVRSTIDRRAMQLLARDRPLRAALDAYVNAGGTPAISDSVKRVQAFADTTGLDLGGVRPIETVTIVSTNGNSTIAGGLDNLLDEFHEDIATYPTDASGNGGGGKSGF